MALSTAPMIAARLMAAGRAGSTPVALGGERQPARAERRIVTTLAGLPEAAATLDGPALLIIGEVAALSSAHSERKREPSSFQAKTSRPMVWVPASAGMSGKGVGK